MVEPYDPAKYYDIESGDELRDGDCVDMHRVSGEFVSGIVASDAGGQYVLSDADGQNVYLTDNWEAIKTFDVVKDA